MSRLKRAIRGVASSYILLAATAFYTLASVFVALHYLDQARFGLWATMGGLIGYLSLIDAGMSSSTARLLIDHKDDHDGGQYGSLIKTGWLVALVQSAIILAIGLVFANSFARLLAIPAELHSEFIHLVYLQCSVVALSFATRIFSMILNAHQRMDLVNYIGTFSLAVNFATQWVFFHLGFGVISLAWAALCATVTMVSCQWLACETLKLFPQRGAWSRASWSHFKEIFAFGKDMFLVVVGTQLIMASQTIVITRLLGLPVAGLWSVGLRVFNLVSQLIWRISDMSGAAFAEMMVRAEIDRLRDRYRAVAVLTASLGGFGAVSFVLCNSLFVPLYSAGKFQWPVGNDVLLGVWMIVMAVLHCHNSFVLTTKKVGFMRYVYFLEGVVFVTLSVLVARPGGLPAIIACSVVCSTVFSGAYGIWRISRYFNLPLREVGWRWLRPMGKMLLFYIPLAGLTWWVSMPFAEIIRLGINTIFACTIGSYLFLRYGISPVFQTEILARVPQRVCRVLKFVFPGADGNVMTE